MRRGPTQILHDPTTDALVLDQGRVSAELPVHSFDAMSKIRRLKPFAIDVQQIIMAVRDAPDGADTPVCIFA